ncbi:MAG: acetyl-CoA carboxylase, biotin carboxyl carrier protein [Legionellales bacterium]|jgi:acetyl-CoA carboxylase biotin carboxyl carrier protein|nr:acetyl-CoA carboxylase, biotin carboxyl carrier protein [Legionellales bacterium]HBH10811.1 acetyl-CoA carboxylase biotin carboxyl carrier protein [Gammaproteobacteria bacterium]|tara:strand:+ start:351 stop:806 length:456 start_codon:yes stop_codon:yes gene_type:complete
MDIRKVKKLIELLEESGIAEIEIHEGEESVRISRGGSTAAPQTVISAPPIAASAPMQASGTTETSSDDYSDEGEVVTAPMVGIFYTSPGPDQPPFINKGQNIKTGDVLCIIEAMKIMNQIEADVDGKVVRILVENGDPVEYGQPLFVIAQS